ncbi:DUF2513 domain-containing protein [Pseudomonas sp. Hp2]|uniref:DUF2513 domain-containing protein n=1 Tax=Pseudomonas sp. Hp2 TaxID=701189 RepID=UPI0011275DD5|nr:DUF2513 domain-containing protein [Pseudomonas sp. Hp2]
MRRDDDLIRKLMLDLEQATSRISNSHAVEGYTQQEVAYHLALIVKSGLAEGPKPIYPSDGSDPTVPLAVMITRLTPEGHDFIADLRDDAVWEKVKERTAKVGGSVSLELLKQLATAVVKQMLSFP